MSSMTFDVNTVCKAMHVYTAPFNNYAQGLYFGLSSKPIVSLNQPVFTHNPVSQTLVPIAFDDILESKEDIYNAEGTLILSKRQLRQCSHEPRIMHYEIELIIAILTATINIKAKHVKNYNPDMKKFIRGWLRDSVQDYDTETVIINHKDKFDDLCEELYHLTRPLRMQVLQNITNPWMMYNITHSSYILSVTEIEDFRIHEWTIKTNCGAWSSCS